MIAVLFFSPCPPWSSVSTFLLPADPRAKCDRAAWWRGPRITLRFIQATGSDGVLRVLRVHFPAAGRPACQMRSCCRVAWTPDYAPLHPGYGSDALLLDRGAGVAPRPCFLACRRYGPPPSCMGKNVSDIFDEVDEELRAERAKKLLQRYSGLIIGAAILLVVAVGAWKAMQWYQARETARVADSYLAAMRAADAPGAAGHQAALA